MHCICNAIMICLYRGEYMKLNVEILAHLLANENAQIIFPDLQSSPWEMVEAQCYQTLCKIHKIVQDDTLEDPECFDRIEQIICAFEAIGSNGGNRHDF